MAKMKMKLERIELNDKGIQYFLTDPSLRQALIGPADEIRMEIPASDGVPGAARKKGDKAVNGRYLSKFTDKNAVANDGRVAVDTGVKGADRTFFARMILQKAIRAAGGKLRKGRKR